MKKVSSLKYIIFIFLNFLLIQESQADFAPAHCFYKSNPKVKVLVQPIYSEKNPGACNGFIVKNSKGKILYTLQGMPDTRATIYASKNGRTVMLLYDYIYSPDFESNLEIIAFYRDAKKTKAYTWKQIMGNSNLYRQSISHISWLISSPIMELSKILEIKTSSFQIFHFDTKTGKVLFTKKTLSSQDESRFKVCREEMSYTSCMKKLFNRGKFVP